MDTTTIKAEFQIWGDIFDVDNVDKILNIDNSTIKRKGNKSTYSEAKIKETSWSVGTGYQESLDINDQLKKISQLLDGKKSELRKVKKLYKVDYIISIVIKVENSQIPAIYLESDMIEFANEIQAEFDFDLYLFS